MEYVKYKVSLLLLKEAVIYSIVLMLFLRVWHHILSLFPEEGTLVCSHLNLNISSNWLDYVFKKKFKQPRHWFVRLRQSSSF